MDILEVTEVRPMSRAPLYVSTNVDGFKIHSASNLLVNSGFFIIEDLHQSEFLLVILVCSCPQHFVNIQQKLRQA